MLKFNDRRPVDAKVLMDELLNWPYPDIDMLAIRHIMESIFTNDKARFNREYSTVSEYAKDHGVCRERVYQMIRKGRLDAFQLYGHLYIRKATPWPADHKYNNHRYDKKEDQNE